MPEAIAILLILAAYIGLMRWVLPKLGIDT
jgi:hypothetical protein